MIAALFVQDPGCYTGQFGVDAWPETRDARLYNGPDPVVAHPPCATWGRYAHKCGGIGNDHGCFASALASVIRWGGVLEHPATSRAWERFNLPSPGCKDRHGFTFYLLQRYFGHEAWKPTVLYVAGLHGALPEFPELDRVPPLRPLEHLSKRQRAATPLPFRNWLLQIAERCRV